MLYTLIDTNIITWLDDYSFVFCRRFSFLCGLRPALRSCFLDCICWALGARIIQRQLGGTRKKADNVLTRFWRWRWADGRPRNDKLYLIAR